MSSNYLKSSTPYGNSGRLTFIHIKKKMSYTVKGLRRGTGEMSRITVRGELKKSDENSTFENR